MIRHANSYRKSNTYVHITYKHFNMFSAKHKLAHIEQCATQLYKKEPPMSECKNDLNEQIIEEDLIEDVVIDEQSDSIPDEQPTPEQNQISEPLHETTQDDFTDSIIPSDDAAFIPAVEYQHNNLYQKVPTVEDPQIPPCDFTDRSTPMFQDVPLMEPDAQAFIPVRYGEPTDSHDTEEVEPVAFNGFAATAIFMLPLVIILVAIFPEHLTIISFALSIIAALFSTISAYNDNISYGKPSVLTTIALICSALVICVMVTSIFTQFVVATSAATIFTLLLLSAI